VTRVRIRTATFLAPALAATFAAGCGTAGLAHLGPLDGCDPELAAGADGSAVDVHRTATPDLACTLSALRDADRPRADQAIQAARVCAELSTRAADTDRMERFAHECVRWARHAGEEPAVRGAARYLEGLCLGNAVRHSPLKAVKSLPHLEKILTAAMKADPDQDDGGPLRVLGMLYLKAPAWPQGIGDVDRGIELITEAAERYPDHPLNRLFLALALWDVEEDRVAAARELGIALRHMQSERWTHVAASWRKEAAVLASDMGVSLPEPAPSDPPIDNAPASD